MKPCMTAMEMTRPRKSSRPMTPSRSSIVSICQLGSLHIGNMLNQAFAHSGSLLLFAHDVLIDTLLHLREHNPHPHGVLLPVTIAASDGLVVHLPGVIQAHECHFRAVLKVQ